MTPVEGTLAVLGALLAAAIAMTGPKAWRALCLALYLPALAIPFLVPSAPPALRGGLGLFAFAGAMRLYERARDEAPRSAAWRALATVFLYDIRYVAPAAPRFAGRHLAEGLALAAVGIAAAWGLGALLAQDAPTLAHRAPRWALMLVAFYGVAVSIDHLLVAGLAAAGWEARPMHDRPILSRSVSELWFRRWNREVGRWLEVHVFRRLARKRLARTGVLSAFAFSALLHVHPMAAGGGVAAGLCAGAFFLAHGVAVALERTLGVARWRPGLGRLWTVAWIAGTWPLFAEPLIAVFYGPSASLVGA